jgi:hypothetical protein
MPQMSQFAARSPESSQLRRRKYELVRQFSLPENLVGGSLSHTHRRCGRTNCHCAGGKGHPQWSITFSRKGKRRVECVPREWVEDLEAAVLQTQAYLEAVREVMAINLELLAQMRCQEQEKKVRARVKNVRAGVKNSQLSEAALDL